MFYNARWYDPAIGRFAQADSLVPSGAQGVDRYAYVNNNPVRYADPTGHQAWKGDGGCTSKPDCSPVFIKNRTLLKQGIIYDKVWSVMNADLRKLHFSYKAEQGYSNHSNGVGLEDKTIIGPFVDLVSSGLDYIPPNVSDIPMQMVDLEMAWSETSDGAWVDSVTVINHSDTVIQISSIKIGDLVTNIQFPEVYKGESFTAGVNIQIAKESTIHIRVAMGGTFSDPWVNYATTNTFFHAGCQSFR